MRPGMAVCDFRCPASGALHRPAVRDLERWRQGVEFGLAQVLLRWDERDGPRVLQQAVDFVGGVALVSDDLAT